MDFNKILDELERATGYRPRPSGTGYQARCPAHDDSDPSLSLTPGNNGKVLFHCFAGCTYEEIISHLSIDICQNNGQRKSGSKWDIAATYDYTDANGKLIYQVVRFTPKRFRPRRPDPDKPGEWLWDLAGVRRVLYRLPETIEAKKHGETIWVVEGEKDAERLIKEGLRGTTRAGGAKAKWLRSFSDALRGAEVAVIPDNDAPGTAMAQAICSALVSVCESVKLVELPGLEDKQDVSDYLNREENSVEDLRALYEAAPLFTAGAPSVEVRTIASKAPLRIAERFLADKYTDAEGRLTLRRYCQVWHRYNGSSYEALADEVLEAELWSFIDGLIFSDGKSEKKLVAKRDLVREVLSALISRGVIVDGSIPQWLCPSKERPDPLDVLPCRNGLVHLPERKLLPLTPEFFCLNGLDYEYSPDAPEPERWLRFLETLFGDDHQSIGALQQFFGYYLTPDTRHQKILLIVGPKRSGKGTIARVLTRVLGSGNVCAPTLAGLLTNFGLSPLLDKNLAIISDARVSAKADQAVIAERLLSISGEDYQTIDRKYLSQVTTKLSARFLILTNELPRVSDASGALASRYVALILRKSFLGVENHDLTDQLLGELPGILNWAIDGWFALREAKRFVQPAASEESLQDLEDLGSPVAAFVRERCTVEALARCPVDALFEAWKTWCTGIGIDRPGTKPRFGSALNAVIPGIRRTQPRNPNGTRGSVYEGVKLNDCS